MSSEHVGIHMRYRWRNWPWRWIKIVNEDTGAEAFCSPWGLEKALDAVTDSPGGQP